MASETLWLSLIQTWQPQFFSPVLQQLEKPEFFYDRASWDQLIGFADDMGCPGPLLAAAQAAPWYQDLPVATATRLAEGLAREIAEDDRAEAEFQRAVGTLARAGISMIVHGPSGLRSRAYPSRWMRRGGEIEIIIKPDDLQAALRALGKAGFTSGGKQGFPLCLRRSADDCGVRIDQELFPNTSPAEIEKLWKLSPEWIVPGLPRRIQRLALEDELASCIAKAFVRGEWLRGPSLLHDVFFLLWEREVQWDELILKLRASGMASGAWAILGFLERQWGAPVPPHVLERLESETNPVRRGVLAKLDPIVAWVMAGEGTGRKSTAARLRHVFS